MSRLPVPGSDGNIWGDILNDYLLREHRVDGTHNSGAILAPHTSAASGAHAASSISFTPTPQVSATNVQAAIALVGASGGSGGGEANTASNIGTGGVGVYKQKVGIDFELKQVRAGSNKLTVTDNVANNTVDLDVVSANLALTKSDVGLANVDNTTDANKPVSTATQIALNAKIDTAQKGAVNGVASLDATGRVPSAQLPAGTDPTMGGDLSGTASNAQIVAGSVGATELAANAVTSAKITDANVTTAKLADNAVTDTKVAAGIDQSKITNLTSDLASKASTTHTHVATDIASGTIATARLGSGTANGTTYLRGDGSWATPAGVSQVSGTAPIQVADGTNAPVVSISAATTAQPGSMSAADKTKLDGIEAGASADMTAAEIMTAVQTVDGTGSGLDADTVDGNHAADFLLSNATVMTVSATPPTGPAIGDLWIDTSV